MNAESPRRAILARFAESFDAARARIDPETGRLLSAGGGFAIGAQGVLYPMALLYRRDDSPRRGDADVLDAAVRVGDALREFQNADGSWEFVKDDGSRWGPTCMPWPFLPWLETWRLLNEDLGPERRERWREGLRLWCENVCGRIAGGERLHNIPAYQAAILVRASDLLNEPAWREPARAYLRRIAETQDEGGYWSEGGLPTTLYNGVYNHALGLYYAFTKDETVLPALRRSLDFHLLFTYPDGAGVETVDGRVRYHAEPRSMGLMGFAPFPDGRALAARIVERLLDAETGPSLDTGLACLVEHLHGNVAEDIPQTRETFFAVRQDRALVRRTGPWFVCLSGYVPTFEDRVKRDRNRWHMEMQHLVSVWRENVGLLVGGGNGKYDPRCASFEVLAGSARATEPEAARLRPGGEGEADALELEYGPVHGALEAVAEDDATFRLRFSARCAETRNVHVRGGFTLWGAGGKELRRGDGPVEHLDPMRARGFTLPSEGGSPVRLGAVRLDLPPGATFEWPVYPFNPYAIDGAAPPGAAVAGVSFALPLDGEAREVILKIEG